MADGGQGHRRPEFPGILRARVRPSAGPDDLTEAGRRAVHGVGMLGAIEAGGTKFICGVGTGPEDLETVEIPTTTPSATIDRAIDFFRQFRADLKAVGIACFGPVDLHPASWTYGYFT